jgi:hypothetical protein
MAFFLCAQAIVRVRGDPGPHVSLPSCFCAISRRGRDPQCLGLQLDQCQPQAAWCFPWQFARSGARPKLPLGSKPIFFSRTEWPSPLFPIRIRQACDFFARSERRATTLAPLACFNPGVPRELVVLGKRHNPQARS